MVCGDAWAAEEHGGRLMVLVADGLGHGPGAAAASSLAVEVFREQYHLAAEEVVTAIHRELGTTRGAAVSVAEVLPDGRARFCGLGDVSGVLATASGRHEMVGDHGTAGHQVRKIRSFQYALEPGVLVILHSDGGSAGDETSVTIGPCRVASPSSSPASCTATTVDVATTPPSWSSRLDGRRREGAHHQTPTELGQDVVVCRQRAGQIAGLLGLGRQDQTRTATLRVQSMVMLLTPNLDLDDLALVQAIENEISDAAPPARRQPARRSTTPPRRCLSIERPGS
jgi:hypothetical protein